jgi:hypothetical protein
VFRALRYFVFDEMTISVTELSVLISLIILFAVSFVSSVAYSDSDEAIAFNSSTLLRGGRRILSLQEDYTTQESVATFNGQIPSVSCPMG